MSAFTFGQDPENEAAAEDLPYDGHNQPCEGCGLPGVVSAFTDRCVHHRCVAAL